MKDNVQKYKDYLAENDYKVDVVELGDTIVSLQARKGETLGLGYSIFG